MCLCLTALLLSHGSGVAKPSRLLKGITIIGYWVGVEKTVFGEGCSIDQSSLATALQFVANQSTKLKVIPSLEVDRRFEEHLAARDKVFKELGSSGLVDDIIRAMKSDGYVAAEKAADEFYFVPHLSFDISPLEVSGTCVGIVKAELSASLEKANMLYRTHTTVYRPEVEIWWCQILAARRKRVEDPRGPGHSHRRGRRPEGFSRGH